MGMIKQAQIEAEEWFVDEKPCYLTMARIMNKEWRDFQVKKVWGKGYTGFTEAAIEEAFKAGFMEGFSGRYFEQTDN